MSEKTKQRREKLREKLIDAAQRHIEKGGLQALKARDIAADAGCAVGAIYNIFSDLDEIVVAVNSNTLRQLDNLINETVAHRADQQPTEVLTAIALTYYEFTRSSPELWSAVFEYGLTTTKTVPDWHVAEHARLIEHITEPVRAQAPGLSDEELTSYARTIFAAVHGVVTLGIHQRFISVPEVRLPEHIQFLVTSFCKAIADRKN